MFRIQLIFKRIVSNPCRQNARQSLFCAIHYRPRLDKPSRGKLACWTEDIEKCSPNGSKEHKINMNRNSRKRCLHLAVVIELDDGGYDDDNDDDDLTIPPKFQV